MQCSFSLHIFIYYAYAILEIEKNLFCKNYNGIRILLTILRSTSALFILESKIHIFIISY